MTSFREVLVALGLLWSTTACERAADDGTAATQEAQHGPSGYAVFTLPSLGGTSSSGNSINNAGWVAGTSNLAGDLVTHAAVWRGGAPIDLQTLGGPNSAVIWPVKNNRGLVSGIAETADLDPLGEDWSCSAFFPTRTGHTCRGFVWDQGQMRPLPTLGGGNGFAAGTNDVGRTVGWAENTVHDPTCTGRHQVLQFRAVIWGPGPDAIEELPPLAGDTVSAATAINDRGIVVGISGVCDQAVGRLSARHAVMWQGGVATDLGDLGGVAWNTPMAMNQRGDAVGFANLADTVPPTRFNQQAVLWRQGEPIVNLRTLDGDTRSQALGINDKRQVVGLSCRPGACRAFIWQDGVMTDLNTLVPSGGADPLYAAGDIDDAGVITGQTVSSAAFVAVPTD
jgi:probable HAF family extracellular repeat protein